MVSVHLHGLFTLPCVDTRFIVAASNWSDASLKLIGEALKEPQWW